jgi:hypothetical protein
MAIFPKTQFPKYQNPIRITRPYIKPNYLADTITSAIQGYGSIQNMNMQQQLFNAKLAQQQKEQAIQDANKAAYQQLIQQQIGTPAGPPRMVGGPHVDHSEMMTGYATTPAVPGMNPIESVMAAMQSNPGARMQDIMAMAGGINTLQNPNKTGGLTPAQLLNHQWRVQRAGVTDAQHKAVQASLQAGRDSSQAKNTATVDSLRRKDINNFELLFDKEVASWVGLHDWDTPYWSGGWDKSGQAALEAFGATTGNPEWAAMRQKATELYMLRRSLGHDESTIKTDIYEIAKQALVPDSDGISHRVKPNEAAAIMQAQINEYSGKSTERRAQGHDVTLPNS